MEFPFQILFFLLQTSDAKLHIDRDTSLSSPHHISSCSSSFMQKRHFSIADTLCGMRPWKSLSSSAGNHDGSSSDSIWIPNSLSIAISGIQIAATRIRKAIMKWHQPGHSCRTVVAWKYKYKYQYMYIVFIYIYFLNFKVNNYNNFQLLPTLSPLLTVPVIASSWCFTPAYVHEFSLR